ncbi:MAG TPA: hypothetical protein VNZ53_09470, partial [Steroidobacteraceae bacterium]|nr:hypothetical protein [Steroidobacteraceae bacterium]
RLRRGDILTHCFRPFPNAPVLADRRIREEVSEARRRGVIFDIGHGGGGSFGFRTAEGMLASGFLPDVISSDVHALSINGPAFQPAGDNVEIPVSRDGAGRSDPGHSTLAPAAALGRQDLGSLESGAVGDATLLELAEGQFDYRDVLGESRSGRWRLNVRGLIVAGRRWHPQPT